MVEIIIKEIKAYLYFLEKQYGWSMYIYPVKNIAGRYAGQFIDFSAHTNEYCRYLKSEDRLWEKCLQRKQGLLKKSKSGIFYAVCHGGVGEYILPILEDEEPIGFLSVGVFGQKRQEAREYLTAIKKMNGLSIEAATYFYENMLCPEIPDAHFVESLAAPAARLFAYLNEQINKKELSRKANFSFPSPKEAVNVQILNYIHHAYRKKITVKQVAEFCNCSESYLNHLFKKMNGMCISNYVNAYRIKKAQELLAETEYAIKEIAYTVGFEEYSYFSRVFKQILGMTPTEYRKANQEEI